MELSTRCFHQQQNIEEIQKQAQLRWFRAAEICEILSNTERLNILIFQRQERPSSGSFFGIKRHMVREFKKDGHSWTKKKDGKTVQEAHEKLKIGNVAVLQCWYVHRTDNEDFQRRIYWMLDEEHSDIAIFHYREAKVKRNRKRCERTKDLPGELPASSLNKCHIIFQPTMEWQGVVANFGGDITSEKLLIRFEKLLSRSSICQNYDHSNIDKLRKLCYKIKPLLKEEDGDWSQMEINVEVNISSEMVKEKILKEKLHSWLLQKVGEGGSGLNELDKGGQGVLHFAAALGYNWALEATVATSVNINLPDVNGWTALHWAVYCRRQHTVLCLISLGAAPVELFYPTPKYPLSKTRVELASETEPE